MPNLSDERLDQLANDPLICNISAEVKCALQELIIARVQIRRMRKEYQEDLQSAARDAAREATWKATQGDDYGSF